MKKISLLLIFLSLSFVLSSCLFEEKTYDEFIISPNYITTAIFEEQVEGYSDNNNFLITSSTYIFDSKVYNNRSVFKAIMPNRNFELLYWNNNYVITKNKDGIQGIAFDDLTKNTPMVESDVLKSYCLNGFGEVIRGQNTNIILEQNYDNTNAMLDGIDPNLIIAFIKDAKTYDFSETEQVLLKSNYYLLNIDNQLILRKVVNNEGNIDVVDSLIDINVNLVKKAIFIENVVYIVLDNIIYSYQIETGEICYREFSNIYLVKQIENYIYVVNDYNNIIVLNKQLEDCLKVDTGNPILGIAWHKDEFNSCLKYLINVDGVLDIKYIDLN